jgi:hypothetical protein
MKKLLMNLSESILSRSQMKGVRGGYGGEGGASGCTNECGNLPSVECKGGSCHTFEEFGGGCKSDIETRYCIST